MAGFTPNEGEALVANVIYKRALGDRDADLELGLFTNVAPDETITEAALTEPTGDGYARITLTDASWTGAADVRAYAQQTFTRAGAAGNWDGIQGYFIATKSSGGTQRLLHIEVDPNGPYDIADGASYKITPSNTVA